MAANPAAPLLSPDGDFHVKVPKKPQLALPRPKYNGQVLLVKPVDDAQGGGEAFIDRLWLALAL